MRDQVDLSPRPSLKWSREICRPNRKKRLLRGRRRDFRGRSMFSYLGGIDCEHEQEHDHEALLSQQRKQLDATIAVAPLVVVPTDHFHETIAQRERQFAVEDA